jgi:acyl transferase domain-containing protein/NAD(P)-dependent dehydrogenase (short-subunit alcohol dehydrogenase family)/acyl carrier protein
MNSGTNAPPTPLAIIGIGCLFPRARDARSYWLNVKHGVDAIGPVPATHWDPADYHDADPKSPDRTYAARGGFLDPVEFRPLDFGIAPNDLEATDTSQLLGLVAARQALQDAGYGPGRDFDRGRVSVLLGVTGTLELVIPLGARLGHPRWRKALKDAGVPDETAERVVHTIGESYVGWQENSFPGLLGNVVAGRIANRLDLGGTNCVVDAACASSLSAIHLAGLELAAGRCDVAVTGGVDTFNDIFMYMCFSKTPALSPTGDAKPFDATGDGTILGEGLGIVVLKRLADAERDGDRVYAVVRGLGSSSDGKGNAVYAPSAAGQVKALRNAYAQAGISPATVELVEAHGTGTRVGDAVEVTALTEVYREARADGTWCALGSVKSQIGHTKAAAGAAGLIKAALALHYKVLPPTIKVTEPLEALKGGSPFYVNTERRPWVADPAHPRRAAVSAFGFGGSNFHCVLEEHRPAKAEVDWGDQIEIVALSAADRPALQKQLDELRNAGQWEKVAAVAAESRRRFSPKDPLRLLIVATRDGAELPKLIDAARAKLAADPGAASWRLPEGVYFGAGPAAGRLAVLFPGQGSQYVGMLRDLACLFPETQDVLAHADHVYARASGEAARLSDAIYPPAAFNAAERERQALRLRETQTAQPAIGAVALGALKVLERFGVEPDAFAGHSYGELPALCAAGCFDDEALHTMSRLRGHLMASYNGADAGGMLAVHAPLDTIEAVLREEALELVVANRNAPAQSVLSGRSAEIERAAACLDRRRVRHTKLGVAAAFHSPLVADARRPFREALDALEFRPARTPVFANTSDRAYPDDPAAVRELLAGQLACPVEFVREVTGMAAAGVRTFLEVGPGATLTKLTSAILSAEATADGWDAFALDATSGGRSGVLDLAHALARLAARGHAVDLKPWRETGGTVPPKDEPRPGLVVPICGANYVAPKAKKPAPALVPLRPERTPAAMTAAPAPTTMHEPPAPRTDRPALSTNGVDYHTPAPAADPSALTQALQVTQQSLAAFQKLQEQTAQLHRQFLESQESAQHTLQMLVEQQQALLLGTPVRAPQSLPARPAPRRPEPVPVVEKPRSAPRPPLPAAVPVRNGSTNGEHVVARAPVAPPPQPAPKPADDAAAVLLAVVAEKTGYPAEMLSPEMALDADLGIDSIKRVEIFSALQERLPDAPAVKPEHLGTLHTLGDVTAFLSSGTVAARAPEKKNPERPAILSPAAPTNGRAKPPLAETARIERSILRVVPLPPGAEPPLRFAAGTMIAVVGERSSLVDDLVRQAERDGLRVSRFDWTADAVILPEIAGLILVAPATGGPDDLPLRAFRWLRAAAPSLRNSPNACLATVTQFGGNFGVETLGDGCDPRAGGLAGLAKTAAHEWPRAVCKAIDVDPAAADLGGRLWNAVLRRGPVEIGITSGGDVALELQPTSLTATEAPILGPNDVVLVTGGVRGVTAAVAVALAERFRPTLVLLGRTALDVSEPDALRGCTTEAEIKQALARTLPGPASPKDVEAAYRDVIARREARRNLERMRAAGARVSYHAADVADPDTVAAAVRAARAEAGPITALVHGAGVLADKRIEDLTDAAFAKVYATKVGGLENLLGALADDPLKAVVLFSSSTARFGRVGQAAYAAANEALNKLAQQKARRRPDCRVVSVNWGPWDGGMVTPALRSLFAAEGVGVIPLDAGADVLIRELAASKKDVEITVIARPAKVETPAPEPAAAFELEVSLRRQPVLRSHVIDSRPVLPLALHLEWLAHAALHGNPGLAFHGVNDLRITHGLQLDGEVAATVRLLAGKASKRGDEFAVPVELRGARSVLHSKAEIVLSSRLPQPPAAGELPPLEPYPHAVADAYRRFLFHGPDLAGIERVEGVSAAGIVGTVRTAPPPAKWMVQPLRGSWLTDPLVIDGAFQLMILWSFERRGAGCLPCFVGRYRQFRKSFPPGIVRVAARVTGDNGTLVRADVDFLGSDGTLVARMQGLESVIDANLERAFRRNMLAAEGGVQR